MWTTSNDLEFIQEKVYFCRAIPQMNRHLKYAKWKHFSFLILYDLGIKKVTVLLVWVTKAFTK